MASMDALFSSLVLGGQEKGILAVILLTAFVFRDRLLAQTSELPLPPGPTKRFLIGNMIDMPKKFEWLAFTEWGKQYNSDVIHLSVAGSDFIVLNSLKAANDLFEKRSTNYSSRPQWKVLNDLMGWNWLTSSMPYNEDWRLRRKLFNEHFHPSKPQTYQPAQIKFIRKMLVKLIDTPDTFRVTLKEAIGGMALTIAYGLPIKSQDDPYLELSEEALKTIIEGTNPGALLVEAVPPLKYIPGWFPGADFQRRLPRNRKLQERFRNTAFDDAVKQLANGISNPSLVTAAFSNFEEGVDIEEHKVVIKDTAGIVFAGGSDTTGSGISTFFLTMLHFPWVQAKAQEELDRVLGKPGTRLPDFSDRADLPYVTAVVNEIIRWRPATPTGIAHYASEEDEYNGYRIPKGSMVFGNAWAMLRDEEAYPDPETFNPDRWLKNGKINPDIQDPTVAAFGFGRRQCPGQHIAVDATWLSAATVLSVIQISKPLDEKGQPIEQEIEYLTGLMSHPAPFKCGIKPRSKEAEILIRSMAED